MDLGPEKYSVADSRAFGSCSYISKNNQKMYEEKSGIKKTRRYGIMDRIYNKVQPIVLYYVFFDVKFSSIHVVVGTILNYF